MTDELTIVDSPDCGNAPRKEIMRDLAVALARADAVAATAPMRDDVVWTVVGSERLEARDDVARRVESASRATRLKFDTVLTHGREASMTGSVVRDGHRQHFSHVVSFASSARTAPVVSVTSYLIDG